MTSGLRDANTEIRVCAITLHMPGSAPLLVSAVAAEIRGQPKPNLKLHTGFLSGYISSDKQLDQDLQICPSRLPSRLLTALGLTPQV